VLAGATAARLAGELTADGAGQQLGLAGRLGGGDGIGTLNGSGMPQANVEKMIRTQIAVGNLTSSSAPSYTQIVDQSVYTDAAKVATG